MTSKILLLGKYWDININLDFGVPGYLFVRNRHGEGDEFAQIKPHEFSELGKMIGLAASAAEHCLGVERVITGKFGLDKGHPLHFHIVPIYDWILAEFAHKTDLEALQKTYPAGYPVIPDGAEIVKFIWHEYCFTGHTPENIKAITNLDEIVQKLSHYIATNKIEFGFK